MNKIKALNDFLHSLQYLALPEISPERVLEKVLELTLEFSGWDLAAVTKLDKNHKVAQIISYHDEGGPQPSWSYDILGTPCFAVINSKDVVIYDNVDSEFIDEIPLTNLGIRVYQGIMYFIAGNPVGHIFLMSKSSKSKQQIEEATSVIRILSLIVGAYVDLIEKGEQVKSFRIKSETDKMTGLRNRNAFDDDIRRIVSLHSDHILSDALLILIDIDGLKQVNDNEGHLAGDKLIKSIAYIILNSSRQEDTAYRIGGDEFALIITGNSKKVHQAINTKVADWRIKISHNVNPKSGVSIGATLLSDCTSQIKGQNALIQEWFHSADELLYKDKQKKHIRLASS